jgi:hypothetical protein
MKLLMVDCDGAIMQEYGDVTAQVDGMELGGAALMVRIPGEGDGEGSGQDVIVIRFTAADVRSIARDRGIALPVATERAMNWASAIADTATALINDQLASCIIHDQP